MLVLLGMSPYAHMWLLEGCPVPWAEARPHHVPVTSFLRDRFQHVPWAEARPRHVPDTSPIT